MKVALSISEKSVITRATWRVIPEDAIIHSHRRETSTLTGEKYLQKVHRDKLKSYF
jgi:hypothetical protein